MNVTLLKHGSTALGKTWTAIADLQMKTDMTQIYEGKSETERLEIGAGKCKLRLI